jgi:hypothetical protein
MIRCFRIWFAHSVAMSSVLSICSAMCFSIALFIDSKSGTSNSSAPHSHFIIGRFFLFSSFMRISGSSPSNRKVRSLYKNFARREQNCLKKAIRPAGLFCFS